MDSKVAEGPSSRWEKGKGEDKTINKRLNNWIVGQEKKEKLVTDKKNSS